MDTEIADRIERSIGSGPDARPSLDVLLAEGHRAVRRRQLAMGSASAAAVAVVAVTAALLGGGASDRAGTEVVQQPTTGLTSTSTTTTSQAVDPTPPAAALPTRAEVRQVLHRVVVFLDEDGRLSVSEGTILRRVDNPFGLAAPGRSVGVELQVGGGTYWYATFTAPHGRGGQAAIYAPRAQSSFESWLQDMSSMAEDETPTAGQGDLAGIPDLDLVSFVGDTEQLAPSAGVAILEQRPHVSVGDSFAGPRDQTAAAEVRDAGGATYYVLARRVGGEPQYIAVPVADGGPDLDAFLDLARDRYAEGGGGLL